MAKKVTDGPLKNKERTKKKILNAVGYIVMHKGFRAVNISAVSNRAGVDRKLIYDYFENKQVLISEYLSSRDFYATQQAKPDRAATKDYGKKITEEIIGRQFDALMESAELREIISWSLSENLQSLKDLNLQRESFAEEVFTEHIDRYFKKEDKDIRAITGILVSSVYYMTLQAKANGGTMCGIDINTPAGEAAIRKTIQQIIDWAYS